jgi:hypothetical protein
MLKGSLVVAILTLALWHSVAAGQDTQALVLSAKSGAIWNVASSPQSKQPIRLARGDTVAVGVELRGTGAGELLLHCGSLGLVSYACTASSCRVSTCSMSGDGITAHRWTLPLADAAQAGPITSAASGGHAPTGGKSGAPRGFWDWLLTREPEEHIIAAARAGGNPTDAVILQDERGLHLGPALTRILEGRVCVRLSSVPDSGSRAPRVLSLDWDRSVDADGIARSERLTPGLYTLEKGNPDPGTGCPADPDAAPVWVLVAPRADFDRLSAAWKQQAPTLADIEHAGVGAPVVRTVRHGVLAWLAESLEHR